MIQHNCNYQERSNKDMGINKNSLCNLNIRHVHYSAMQKLTYVMKLCMIKDWLFTGNNYKNDIDNGVRFLVCFEAILI